jgi:hypothetical protein
MLATKVVLPLCLLAFCFSCTGLERKAQIISLTSLEDQSETARVKSAKGNVLRGKQSLKLAIIKLNLMKGQELRTASGRKKSVFLQASAFAPIQSGKFNDSFHLFMGDPIFTKLIPEFYQLLSAIEHRQIPLTIDCMGVSACDKLVSGLKKQYSIVIRKILSADSSLSDKRGGEFLFMLSSTNLSSDLRFSSRFRSAFKHSWLDFPSLQAQGLKIEEWANLIPKVKEF